MNTTEAAAHAAVAPATIRTWCRRGVVSAVKTAGRWDVDPASLKRRIALGRRSVGQLLAMFTDPEAAQEKALDLIDQQALVPGVRPHEYIAVSSDAASVYLVDTVSGTCGCKGNEYVGRCYHMVAAVMVETKYVPTCYTILSAV